MALRDQPYLPLFIQDFLTDEKLAECSASATGVYIRLMCLMHKSDDYGKILLKQKYKKSNNPVMNFASQIAKQMPYDFQTVTNALVELLDEKVLIMEGEVIIQKRMVKDNALSEKRSSAGKKGGDKTLGKHENFAQANAQAKVQANSEYEYEDESIIKSKESNSIAENLIFQQYQVIPIDKLLDCMLSDDQWVQDIARIHHLSTDYDKAIKYSKEWISLYVDKLRGDNVKEKPINECFGHCSNWIKQEKNRQNNGKQQQEKTNVFVA